MASLLDRLARLFRAASSGGRGMLGGFTDSLVQTFENSRSGLDDDALADGGQVEAFFEEIFERERPRLLELCSGRETGLRGLEREAFRKSVEKHFRKVVLPAYIRTAQHFTRRERNGFYLAAEAWHGAERFAWAVAGMALGGFVIWAPFIPIWEKEWVAVFAMGGLVLPELRRYIAFRRYQSELNRIVTRADDEIFRLDMALVERMATRAADGAFDEEALAAEEDSEQERFDGSALEAPVDALENESLREGPGSSGPKEAVSQTTGTGRGRKRQLER